MHPGSLLGPRWQRFQEEAAEAFYRPHGAAHVYLAKAAGDAVRSYSLSGRLYLSDSGWLLLSVPAALVRGAFDALHEPGAELPLKDGKFTPHVSVMSAAEVQQVGGGDKISERGHSFSYSLGALKSAVPSGWDEMGRAWFITVDAPGLRALRKSYGLEPLRKGFDMHISVAVRRKHVLRDNDITKQGDDGLPYRERVEVYGLRKGTVLSGLHPETGKPSTFGGGVEEGETHNDAALRELLEETGYRAANPRLAGLPALVRDWDAEQQARRPGYRGDRTTLMLADVLGGSLRQAADRTHLTNVRFRRPDTLLAMLSRLPEHGPFEKLHQQALPGISSPPKAAFSPCSGLGTCNDEHETVPYSAKQGGAGPPADVLYHGSPHGRIRTLKPHLSDLLQSKAVFATPDERLAVSMAVPDIPANRIAVGYENGRFTVDELKPGALKTYERPSWLYRVASSGFAADPRLMREERVHPGRVPVLGKEKVEHTLDRLKSLGAIINTYDQVDPDKYKRADDHPYQARVEEAARDAHPSPTPAQQEAGNYAKGHVWIHGLSVSIENARGSTRRGVGKDGTPWSVQLRHHYGYVRGTKGKDGDHVDVYLGPHPHSEMVYVVNQRDPGSGDFDEHKVMLGFYTADEAKAGYLANYTKGWRGLGPITAMTIDQFKWWLANVDMTKEIKDGFWAAPANRAKAAKVHARGLSDLLAAA